MSEGSGHNLAISTTGLGKRYSNFWALEDCNISIPAGRVTALVGPNGAGKTTLLKLLTGLASATTGSATIFGAAPSQAGHFLSQIGYLSQEIPLYKTLSAREHIVMGRGLNPQWDEDLITSRLSELGIPLSRPVSTLSGGQKSQVALALALAKKPKLLLLDEPVAALDPLARAEFLSSLAQAVANGGLTVLMSSHLLNDLERVCDRLIILASGKTQLCDDMENVLKTHRHLSGPHNAPSLPSDFVQVTKNLTPRQTSYLVYNPKAQFHLPGWRIEEPTIEDVVLGYMGQKHLDQLETLNANRGQKA